MESIWTQNVTPPTFPSLPENITADAAVIGGGICGILTAYFLQKEGLNVVILEANTLCSGQTHLTTAKITYQHGLFYHNLIKEQGFTQAKCYADANRQAISMYESLVGEHSIPCFFEKLPSYLYSANTQGTEILAKEKAALLSLGLDCQMHKQGNFTALSVPGQAQFHPLLFLYGLSSGLQIYEHTKVLRVKGHVIDTEKYTVTADKIIFACHYPFPILPGAYFLKMHQERSYAIAVKTAQMPPPGMYYGIDERTPSIRSFQDTVIIGGQGHRTGKNETAFRYQTLRTIAAEYFPEATTIREWSAQDCISVDKLPYIGQFSPAEPDWYIATGFHKWGMSLSMVSALLLTDQICGRTSPYTELFSPKRHWSSSAWKTFSQEIKQASISLSKSAFAPGAKIDCGLLPPGEGCIARINGKKVGVYRDEDNLLHFVSPRCPHLGCQLAWNPEEKTWDCPCHGSRFHATGELIDGPAQKGINVPR